MGHGGTSAANPILISEEQKARMWKKGRFVIGPLSLPTAEPTTVCLSASFRPLGRRTKKSGHPFENRTSVPRTFAPYRWLKHLN